MPLKLFEFLQQFMICTFYLKSTQFEKTTTNNFFFSTSAVFSAGVLKGFERKKTRA